MTTDRILAAQRRDEDDALETSLRPRSLVEYIGQEKVKGNLSIAIAAAKQRNEPLDHVLLYGPPGLGKTTLANIVAVEMGVSIRTTSGPAIERPGDLAAILTNLQPEDVLFIDEVHRLPRTVEEILYPAMEDWALDLVLGKGPGARSVRLALPHFTLIGATTRYAMMSPPMRDRFGVVYRLDFYDVEAIAQIVGRSARILEVELDEGGRDEIARLEYRIQNNTATLEAPLDDLKKQLRELYGPIDDMFKELQTRLEQIPTAEQRAAVAQRQQPVANENAASPKP